MNLLLDSHALLWALHDPGRLRPESLNAIRDPERTVFFSAASVWELELKAARGKLNLPPDWLMSVGQCRFLHIGISAEEARASARLPWHHNDPFDRLLIAQARVHNLLLASRDAIIRTYDVRVLVV